MGEGQGTPGCVLVLEGGWLLGADAYQGDGDVVVVPCNRMTARLLVLAEELDSPPVSLVRASGGD